MSARRDANPKDKYGLQKVPIGLVPSSSIIYQALAQRDGAVKYGPFNWREKPILVSIFYDACLRHLHAFHDREELASDSGVPHLGHALACIGIIVDAMEFGNAIDDRPPAGTAQRILDRFKREAPDPKELDELVDTIRGVDKSNYLGQAVDEAFPDLAERAAKSLLALSTKRRRKTDRRRRRK